MMTKAVAAVKADKAKALDEFNAGTGGFLVGDLYPFCYNISDGKVVAVANPNAKNLIGQDIRIQRDSTGKEFGLEQFAAAQKPGKGNLLSPITCFRNRALIKHRFRGKALQPRSVI